MIEAIQTGRKLKRKPLVEALVEIRWTLRDEGGSLRDVAYPILPGRLFDLVKNEYPVLETLPSVQLPEEISAYMVKYRFRSSKDSWPLIQVGPGIATLNYTESYHWEAFLPEARRLFRDVSNAYHISEEIMTPQFSGMLLRFINAVEFDYVQNDVTRFVSENLHIGIKLPSEIETIPSKAGYPASFQFQVGRSLGDKTGLGTLRIVTGTREGKPALLWELMATTGSAVPQSEQEFADWLGSAHAILETWFFSLIKGNLEKQFDKD